MLRAVRRPAGRIASVAQFTAGSPCFLGPAALRDHQSAHEDHPPFPHLASLLADERTRLQTHVGLIASQNVVFPSVASVLHHVHMQSQPSEGRPGMKLYAGCEVIEKIEILCEQEALKAFGLDPDVWAVDSQLLSCSSANISAAMGLLSDGDALLSLLTSHGGHISHGNTASSPLKRLFKPRHYGIDTTTGMIDYTGLKSLAHEIKPKLIFTGASTQTRDTDYRQMREIADISNAHLIADISHTSGLIAADQFESPFQFCDVVTSSTYKGLRGPRSAVMFFRKELGCKLQSAVFPGLQSGPRNMLIAGMCEMFRQLQTEEYSEYVANSVRNARRMASKLMRNGFKVLGNGTDSHQFMLHVGDAVAFERKAEMARVTLNRNMWPGDRSPFRPTGVRIGTNLTTVQGYDERDYDFLADVLSRVRSSEPAESIAADVRAFLSTKEPLFEE